MLEPVDCLANVSYYQLHALSLILSQPRVLTSQPSHSAVVLYIGAILGGLVC